MAYIAPNSTIQVFRGVNLHPDYENTVVFASVAAQNTYFNSIAVATFSNVSYQRVSRNVLKLQGSIATLYNINYMRFRNESFEDKWFYAFVTRVDYVNNETVEIEYELDYMQTWLWSVDYTFQPCYIERQHAASDKYFEHLEAENVDLGPDYITFGSIPYYLNKTIDGERKLNVGFLVSRMYSGTVSTGVDFGGIFSGLLWYGCHMEDAPGIIQRYNAAAVATPTVASPEDIVVIYMYPSEFDIGAGASMPVIWHDEFQAVTEYDPDLLINIDGYVPKNKKLFNAPYQYLEVYNGDCTSKDYHWEQWMVGETLTSSRSDTISHLGKFFLTGTPFPPVSAVCYPKYFSGTYDEAYDSGVTIENFPQCAWNSDVFKAWWAQNKATTAVNLMSSGISTGINVGLATSGGAAYKSASALGSAAESSGGFLMTAAKTVAQMSDLEKASPNVHGTLTSESLRALMDRYTFYFRYKCIHHEFAEAIDNYFTMYGYSVEAIATPNIQARTRWTYLKTRGCQLMGQLPTDVANKIAEIYDKGTRVWKDISEIGQYNLTNNPIYT